MLKDESNAVGYRREDLEKPVSGEINISYIKESKEGKLSKDSDAQSEMKDIQESNLSKETKELTSLSQI